MNLSNLASLLESSVTCVSSNDIMSLSFNCPQNNQHQINVISSVSMAHCVFVCLLNQRKKVGQMSSNKKLHLDPSLFNHYCRATSLRIKQKH